MAYTAVRSKAMVLLLLIHCLLLLPLCESVIFLCFVVRNFMSILVCNHLDGEERAGPEVIKLFSCSTQLSTKFQLLIKTDLPTNEEVSCFKSLRYCIYHAHKC